MTTKTDTAWEAIKAAFPANFLTNQTASFAANTGWLANMINRIGMTRCYGVDTFNNSPFVKYNRGVLGFGDTVQSYKTKVITPIKYDPDSETSPFAAHKNPPISQYNTVNVAKSYPLTVAPEQIVKAFTSEQKLGDFVATQMSALAESDIIDQYTEWKKYVSNESLFTIEDTGTDIYDTVREMVMNFRTPSTDYNKAGDKAISTGKVDIILTKAKFLEIGTKLGQVYHPDYIALDNATIRWIDDFATPDTASKQIDGIVVDERALNRWVRPPMTWGIQNSVTGAFDYTYKLESIYGIDSFRNAVMLESAA